MSVILATTDLSERADRAIERAFMMAGETGAEVVVATVVDDALPRPIAERVLEDSRNRLGSHLAALSVAQGIAHRIVCEIGEPHRVLLAQAAMLDPMVIVTGMHRHRGFLDFFRGTTLSRIVRGGIWPVLVVRDHPDRPYRRTLVGVDFSEAARRALRAARRIAPSAERQLFHAYAIPFKGYLTLADTPGAGVPMGEARYYDQEARRQMAAFMAEMGETAPPIVEEGAFRSVLDAALRTVAPDLLAVGVHGRSGIARLVLGSGAEELMQDPPCDLLVA